MDQIMKAPNRLVGDERQQLERLRRKQKAKPRDVFAEDRETQRRVRCQKARLAR